MSLNALWKLHALSVPSLGVIPTVTSRDFDFGIVEYMHRGDGRVSADFRATMLQKPAFSFSTPALATVLTLLGGKGFYYTTNPVDLYVARRSGVDGIAAGAVHRKITSGAGAKVCIIARQISAKKGNTAAMISCDGYFLSADGVAAPIALTNAVSLPALPSAAEAFTIGGVKLNGGNLLDGIGSIDIDFGNKEEIHDDGGKLYPDLAVLDTHDPTASFSTSDMALLDTLTVGGLELSAASFFFRKLAPAGRVPDGTAQHVKLGLTKAFAAPGKNPTGDDGFATQDVQVRFLHDNNNAVMSINTASAIS